jgi:hypothetical protein
MPAISSIIIINVGMAIVVLCTEPVNREQSLCTYRQ